MVTVLPVKSTAANALDVANTIAADAAVRAVTAQRVILVFIYVLH
jgi:hypothetical protein